MPRPPPFVISCLIAGVVLPSEDGASGQPDCNGRNDDIFAFGFGREGGGDKSICCVSKSQGRPHAVKGSSEIDDAQEHVRVIRFRKMLVWFRKMLEGWVSDT